MIERTVFNNRENIILTNDPSFKAWGYCAITLSERKVVDVGCIKTDKESTKRRIREGDDLVRRISEITDVLLGLTKKYNIKMVLCELPHGSQTARAAVMIGAVTGIMQSFATTLQIPTEWFSEYDAKKTLLNRRKATKDEVIQAIDGLYTIPWTGVLYKDEAIADAMAIYNCAIKKSTSLQILTRAYASNG